LQLTTSESRAWATIQTTASSYWWNNDSDTARKLLRLYNLFQRLLRPPS